MEENPCRTLFLLFEQYKTPAVPYFSILKRSKPQPYLFLAFKKNQNPWGRARYCGGIGLLLDFHCDVDRLRIDSEVTSLYDISFQHHNDVVAIT